MDKIFNALSSTTRRKILAYLSSARLNAGEIAERFDMSKPSISKHLDVLENAGLIRSEKVGQFVYYSLLRDNLVTNLYDFLNDFCPVSQTYKQESAALRAKGGAQEAEHDRPVREHKTD